MRVGEETAREGASMAYVTTNDGVRVHYEERGRGRPTVLIHGWTFSRRFFSRNVDAFPHGDLQTRGCE